MGRGHGYRKDIRQDWTIIKGNTVARTRQRLGANHWRPGLLQELLSFAIFRVA